MPTEKIVSVGSQSFSFIDQRKEKPPFRKFSCFVIHKVI